MRSMALLTIRAQSAQSNLCTICAAWADWRCLGHQLLGMCPSHIQILRLIRTLVVVQDLQHREEARAAAARDAAWQSDMIDAGRRTGIVYQTSSILRHVDYTNYQQAFPKKLPSAAASAAAPEAAFQPTSMRGRRPGGDSSGDIAAQKAAWVLSVRQLQPWGPNFAHRDLQ